MSNTSDHRRKASKSRWQLPLAAFSYTSQLEVITVIANCGVKTELAAEAVFKYIQSKQRRGRTEEEILNKLEVLERKFLDFTPLHVSFQAARRATGLPPSQNLSAIPISKASSSASSSHTIQQSAPPSVRSMPLSVSSDASEALRPETRSPTPIVPAELQRTPSVPATLTRPRTASDRGVYYETQHIASNPVSLLDRRHSLHLPSPPATPTPEGEPLAWTITQNLAAVAERKDRRPRPALMTRLDTQETFHPGHARVTSQDLTPTSFTSPHHSWGAPGVAFAPPPNPASAYTPDASTPSSKSFIDMDSRPSTAASYYSTDTEAPSVTSFQVMDTVRQSVTPKMDPELLESLFSSASAETFLRLFRA